jgi:threonyl-tRNA synthetase
MNDAHIYCTPEQIESEFRNVITMYRMYYGHLRMGNFRVRLSLHDKNSDKFVDRYDDWEHTENIVRGAWTVSALITKRKAARRRSTGRKWTSR